MWIRGFFVEGARGLRLGLMVKRVIHLVKKAERTCLLNSESRRCFLVFFCEPVVGKGIKKIWDVHYGQDKAR